VDDLVLPSPPLRPFVEGYWSRRGVYEPPRQVRVLADACTKIIFELVPMPWSCAYVIGTQLTPILVSLTGEVDRIGIRFRPGMAWFFLNTPLDALAGRLTDLADVPMNDGGQILGRLRDEPSLTGRTAVLDVWLLSLLALRQPWEKERNETAQLSRAMLSGTSPPDLAASIEWSTRQLQRVCRERFGASAAKLHRFHRFEILQARLNGLPVDLADLAAELGFSDQAHMAREFRYFAGTTISGVLRERASVGNIQDASGWLPVLRKAEETGAW
jgi:AraC-like DNA-binding protein